MKHHHQILILITLTALPASSCSKRFEDYFRKPAAESITERVPAGTQVSCERWDSGTTQQTYQRAKADVLFVIDNSSSMGGEQQRLSEASGDFSSRFLTGVAADQMLDLHIARITTDTFFAGYPGYNQNDHCDILARDEDPLPLDFARLIPGFHDGRLPYASRVPSSDPNCARGTRASAVVLASLASGTPKAGAALSTLVADLAIITKPGIRGLSHESPTSSILRLLDVNERGSVCQANRNDPSCLFRPGSRRAIVILSDAETDNCGSDFAACPPKATRVAMTKGKLDQHFRELDGSGAAGDPNYFTLSIVSADDRVNGDDAIPHEDFVNALRADSSNSQKSASVKLDLTTADLAQVLTSLGQNVSQGQWVPTTTFAMAAGPAQAIESCALINISTGAMTPLPVAQCWLSGATANVLQSVMASAGPGFRFEACVRR